MAPELTRQQLDPASGPSVRGVVAMLSAGALVYALVMTALTKDIRHPLAESAAVVCFSAACLIVVLATSPYRAPFSARTLLVVQGFVFVAIALEVSAQLGGSSSVLDDWGPIGFGVLMMALSPYRPAREIAASGVISAIFIGFATLLRTSESDPADPPLAVVVLSVTPMLALCLSAATFSRETVASMQRFSARVQIARTANVSELRDGVTRSVVRNRISILEDDVVPFFVDVLERDEITDSDRDAARAIAESLRSVMVEEVDRTWLESLVELYDPHDEGTGFLVRDADRVAGQMTTQQRTALRALIVSLLETPRFDRRSLSISLTRGRGICQGILIARLDRSHEGLVRSAFSAYFAVMHAVFTELQNDSDSTRLTLRFSYEQL